MVWHMTKARSSALLFDELDRDLVWRLQEISNLKIVMRKVEGRYRQAVVRAFVPILYAHWEGFIKFASKSYINYVCARRIKIAELSVRNRANYGLEILRKNYLKGNLYERARLIEQLLSAENEYMDRIDIQELASFNLNHELLCKICFICDVDSSLFEGDKTLIDEKLLKRRNKIAHGETISLVDADIDELSSDILNAMRVFKDQVQNNLVISKYRKDEFLLSPKPPSSPPPPPTPHKR